MDLSARWAAALIGSVLVIGAVGCRDTGAVVDAREQAFVQAVMSGDPDQVMGLLDARAQAQVDRPVLAAWQRALATRLGMPKRFEPFLREVTPPEGADETVIHSTGKVHFENGTADVAIDLVGGRIVGFSIDTDRMADDWFEGPAQIDLYRRRGEELLTYIVTDLPRRAHEMLGDRFRQTTSIEALGRATMAEPLLRGRLKDIAYAGKSFRRSAQGAVLRVAYDLTCEKGTSRGYVDFRFIDLKGHIVRFDPGKLQPASDAGP